ncbi:hypothetical protein Bca101_049141 [Brassica carinata]
MKKKSTHLYLPCLLTLFLALLRPTTGDARTRAVRITCSPQLERNETVYISNFVATWDKVLQQVQTNGFGVASTGSGPSSNYGLAQCYGDLSLNDCFLCYSEARANLPQCYPQNGGRVFLDGCFMRAENYSFFNEFKGPEDDVVCGGTTTRMRREEKSFGEAVRLVVRNAVAAAPGNGGYARGASANAFVLANCWRSLSAESCKQCLEDASASVVSKCLPWSVGRAIHTGCFLRYSDHDFLNKIPRNRRSRGSVVVIVVSVLSSVFLFIVGIAVGVNISKHRTIEKKRRGSNDVEKMAKILTNSSLNFKYTTLEKATGSFDSANMLGQGGFGAVFKGVLPDGRDIAVKRLFFNNTHRAGDFYNEVNIISTVEHKNLVRLLGCSCSGPESILVYEHIQNKSLDRFIFGTLGYMAPEYVVHGQLTEKVDVYSFGVLVLEIVTGKQITKSEMSEYLVTEMLKNKKEVLPLPSNPPFLDENVMELAHVSNSTPPTYTSHATISQNSLYCR